MSVNNTDKKDNEQHLECATHHIQQPLCHTRPQYRQGRNLKSVKTYSINDESQYLIANGIPDINIREEFKTVCLKYGHIEHFDVLENYPTEKFEKVFIIKYDNISNSRFAKKHLDNMSFYGGVLHVCYAPEKETIQDTRHKLEERRKKVNIKLINKNKYTDRNNLKSYPRSRGNSSSKVHPYNIPLLYTEKSICKPTIGPQLYPSQISDPDATEALSKNVSSNFLNTILPKVKTANLPKFNFNRVNIILPVSIMKGNSCQPSIESLNMPIKVFDNTF